MLRPSKVQTASLTIHGVLALFLGLAFFYLRKTMTNPFFEEMAVILAIMLAAAVLIVAAVTDWFAAFSSGMKSVHRFVFYLLAGTTFALVGVFLGYYPVIYMRWLVIFAAVHALAFGVSATALARNAHDPPQERRVLYTFGAISFIFSAVMAGWVNYLDDPGSTAVLGCYLCFVGFKILFFAWNSRRRAAKAEEVSSFGPRPQ